MSRPLLLATDLDRTLLPNGHQPEAAGARERFAAFVAPADVGLVYVSGRDIRRVAEAIEQWSLPVPLVAVADVGTSVWSGGPEWTRDARWDAEIGKSWGSDGGARIRDALSGLGGLAPQADDRQGPWKVSFSRPSSHERGAAGDPGDRDGVAERLAATGLSARAIWSVDEAADEELLDVLPEAASKLHALNWLHRLLGYAADDVVFAGDSGNDLEVMASGLSSVLVGNARAEIKAEARRIAAPDSLYVADAFYADGILEGVRHFRPDRGAP